MARREDVFLRHGLAPISFFLASGLLRAPTPHYDKPEAIGRQATAAPNHRKDFRDMIQYVCDLCHSTLDPKHDLSYVVRMEVYAAPGDAAAPGDDDRDYLEEIHDILERLDDSDPDDRQLSADTYQKHRFDLCRECCQRFLQDPLGRRPVQKFNFSQR